MEKSPYLIQHKDNPVHWMPWSEKAFILAKKEDKPILLSVGYAACHWCHVMAHESFEDEGVASLMNDHFINIKVDREERPDIDAIYMSALHAMGVHGGWPMTIFMTPEKKAFWGGTYFSKEPLNGAPSFPNILVGISNAYKNDKNLISENYKAIDDSIRKKNTKESAGSLSIDILDRVSEQLLSFSDKESGGLRGAPWTFVLRFSSSRDRPGTQVRPTPRARAREVVSLPRSRPSHHGLGMWAARRGGPPGVRPALLPLIPDFFSLTSSSRQHAPSPG